MDTQKTTSSKIPVESLDQHHLHEMLTTFSSMMLGTFEESAGKPQLRARPMSVAKVENDCTLLFVTSFDSSKTEDAKSDPDGTVIAQSSSRYVSMLGTYRVSRDPARLKEIWSKPMDAWFDGPEDPRACILEFRPTEAELWDTSGARGLRYLFGAAKAMITGDKPPVADREQHANVSVKH